jgi:hypothetical protein
MPKEKSVRGLANIGLLVSAGALRANPPKPKDEGDVKAAIIKKTLGAMPNTLDASKPHVIAQVERIVTAAVREAFNAGHANALDQNSMVEELLKKQYTARTELTLPVACMAIMEQTGLSDILLDMDAVASVSSRCRIEMVPEEDGEDGKLSMRFSLRNLGDGHGQVQ